MLKALKANALGNIEKHKVNIEIYMHNAVGIGEHSDIMSAIAVSYTHLTLPTNREL